MSEREREQGQRRVGTAARKRAQLPGAQDPFWTFLQTPLDNPLGVRDSGCNACIRSPMVHRLHSPISHPQSHLPSFISTHWAEEQAPPLDREPWRSRRPHRAKLNLTATVPTANQIQKPHLRLAGLGLGASPASVLMLHPVPLTLSGTSWCRPRPKRGVRTPHSSSAIGSRARPHLAWPSLVASVKSGNLASPSLLSPSGVVRETRG